MVVGKSLDVSAFRRITLWDNLTRKKLGYWAYNVLSDVFILWFRCNERTSINLNESLSESFPFLVLYFTLWATRWEEKETVVKVIYFFYLFSLSSLIILYTLLCSSNDRSFGISNIKITNVDFFFGSKFILFLFFQIVRILKIHTW